MENSGIRSFFVMWGAQMVSVLGSQLSGFALGVWVYDLSDCESGPEAAGA